MSSGPDTATGSPARSVVAPDLAVQVDPLRRDPGLVQRVDLPVQVLLRGRDPPRAKIYRRNVREVLLVPYGHPGTQLRADRGVRLAENVKARGR